MAQPYETEGTNGIKNEPQQQQQQQQDDMYNATKPRYFKSSDEETESLYDAVLGLISSIFFPDHHSGSRSSSFFTRTKESMRENLPHIRDASRATGFRVLRWARQGSPLRLLLVISVGTITLLTITGVLLSLLFVAAATVNAIVLSLFMSLAAAGGFLAIFFACVAVIYIGALSVAVFVISSATLSAIITVLIVTGWIGFFWIVWLAMSKSAGLAKHSVSMTGSALSAYTSVWHARRHGHNHHD